MKALAALATLISLLALPTLAWAAVAAAAPAAHGDAGGDALLNRPIVLVVALAIVSLIPFVFMSVTAFVKISTVLQIVKSAIGAQSVPSNTVIMALSAALTFIAMAAVGDRITTRLGAVIATKDLDTVTFVRDGIAAVREPIREFLTSNANEREKTRFLTLAERSRGSTADQVRPTDLTVLVPAFVVTELGEAFAVGFLLFLPFLVIDLVIANVLLALGMQMLNPTQVSLPFKLLLFIAIDGWGLLAQALVTSYR